MRIIIELDNGQPEPQVQVNNNQANESSTNPVAMAGAAINAGAPKTNTDNTSAMSDNASAMNDVQSVSDNAAMNVGADGPTTSAGEAPLQ